MDSDRSPRRLRGDDVAGLLRQLIPVTIGNIIGGGVLVGGVYWLIYLHDHAEANALENWQSDSDCQRVSRCATVTPCRMRSLGWSTTRSPADRPDKISTVRLLR